MEFSRFFNNTGDEVRFLSPAQTVLDATSYPYATAEYAWYRFPDGGPWSGIESPSPSKGRRNPGTGDLPWLPGAFEIRVFDVEQGDSQLIIFPSGYTLLIDVSEASYNSGKGAAFIAAKIRAITGGAHINVGVLSHLHLDHIGYAGAGGFWRLLEIEGITFDKIIDRDAGVWIDGLDGSTPDGVCNPDTEIDWHNAGAVSGTAVNWLCYATDPANDKIYPIRELAEYDSSTQIDPPDAGAQVKIIQVDAAGVMMADGLTPVAGDHTADMLPPSENSYSISLKISYGQIDYATGGDTGGEYATSAFDTVYNDGESVNAALFGPVEILRANHHGSGHSTNQTYVDTLSPELALISCGDNVYGHPDQTVLDRLTAVSQVYLTNQCDETRDYQNSHVVAGDIIIRSSDGLTYDVVTRSYLYLPAIVTP